eukprot:m.207755 g.207755  ORF g.207755 m.207755 type:complete len:461 (+) comp39697_c1_seq16:2214-3596(+)
MDCSANGDSSGLVSVFRIQIHDAFSSDPDEVTRMNLREPKLFRRDELEYDETDDFIGSGEFGSVFRAKRKDTDELVALKLLTTPQRLRQQQVDWLKKEASVLQYLHYHPNIVRLLGLCVHPRHYALVLEYVEFNLDKIICNHLDRHPRIKQWPCRLTVAYEVAMGMTYLHSLNPPIIHKDLKSSNLLIDVNYHCKISDFGLAKVRGISSQTTRRTERGRGNPSGTLPFIAPERFHGDFDITEKVDVYGYAIILWQLKELKRPYGDGMSHAQIRDAVVHGDRRPSISSDDSKQDLIKLIQLCWNHNPMDRPSFREISETLDTTWPTVKTTASAMYTKQGAVLSSPEEEKSRPPPSFAEPKPLEKPAIGEGNFKDLLKSHWTDLMSTLDAVQIADYLFSNVKHMDSSHREKITTKPDRQSQARELLKYLEIQGSNVFTVFLSALQIHQPHLYQKLRGCTSMK